MAISKGRSNLQAWVEDNLRYLGDLLHKYPAWLDSWTAKTDAEFKQTAKDTAEGDEEIEQDIYWQMLSVFDGNDYKSDTFNKAMLIMAYSFYEQAVPHLLKLSKRPKTNDLVDLLCKANDIKLSLEEQKAKDFLHQDVRNIRNYIVHNDASCWQKGKKVETICKKHNSIQLDSNSMRISFSNDKFIVDALEASHTFIVGLIKHLEDKRNKLQTKKIQNNENKS